ncbi:MAG: pyridoxamine 5'-phosphate oxidase [Acidimicrobiales bacterium]
MLESDVAADPIVQFRAWWEEARATGDAWSEAMVLATSSPAGGPSARAVILRGVDERGFVFFTDTRSAKAVELEADPRVALVVLWSSLERQVRVVGHAAPVTEEEADAFFAARPRAANLAAQVARQDEVIAGPDVLQRRLHELAVVHDGRPVGRPPGWGGYVVAPDAVELWQGQPDHLHDRLRYRRDGAGWRIERLAP